MCFTKIFFSQFIFFSVLNICCELHNLKVFCLHLTTLIEVVSSGIVTGCYPVNKKLLLTLNYIQYVDLISLTVA